MFGKDKKQLDGLGLDVLWPPPGSGDQETAVDIVFVHGLGGRRHSTWTKDEVLWPRDLLAKDFPRARIMTWGYDSHVMRFFGPVGQGNIRDHARSLNRDLSQERIEDHQVFRPIIFFAHSLGGLVVKNALLLSYLEGVKETPSNSNNARIATIKWCTKGILFAGTPHHGSDKAKWATTATTMAWFVRKDQSTHLVDALKRGSDTLDELQDTFKDILESFAVYTLIEDIPFPKIGKIVERDSARIGWHEVEILIHADHRDMVRFGHAEDNNYIMIKNTFREIIRDHIERAALGKAGMPNWNRAKFLAALDVSRPSSSGMPPGLTPPGRLTLEHRSSRDFSFGRVQTLADEWLTARRSAERLGTLGSSGRSMERLSRDSTTTLGTMGSNGSRESNARSRVSEGGRRSPGNNSQFADLMEQGLYYMHKKDKKLYAQNLITARQYFANAQNTLTSFKPDPAQSVSVLYQLMNVEFEMAFNRDMSAEEKISHLQKAEQYGWDASGYARQSSNAGDSAHVKLFLGVIKGRKAEVHAKLGVSPEDIRKQKDEALSEIFIAMKEVRESGHVNLKQSIDFSTTWTQRLKEPMPEPQTNIPFRAELGLTSTLF